MGYRVSCPVGLKRATLLLLVLLLTWIIPVGAQPKQIEDKNTQTLDGRQRSFLPDFDNLGLAVEEFLDRELDFGRDTGFAIVRHVMPPPS